MLQAINDRIKGWLGIVIVILIGLPFALWGINSYFDDAGPRYAAKVNNIEISAREFERTFSLQRQRMLNQYNGKLPVDEKVLRERTLTQLVNQRLLEGAAFDKGYRISDSLLASRIKQQFTVDGVFDRARFEVSVASLGMSVPMYEDALRNELRVKQMQSAISSSAFVTNKDLKDLAALSEQTRDISVLSFDVEHFSTAAKPTEEEIKQYYHENKQRFMLPEKVKVDYVEITSQSLADKVEIDEAQIKQMYDEYVASISGREERKVSHILIQTSDDKKAAEEKIQQLKQEIDGGADFAELARKHSQDTVSAADGGELGWVSLGEMAKPFEKALFDLQLSEDGEGTVSDVVETQFGFHLIKLEDVRSETVESMAVKRHVFEQELKEEAAASLFYDLSERLASISYENPDNLDTVVEELGLEIKSSEDFTRFNGAGVSANDDVRRVAFSPLVLEQGSNSDIIELSPTHVIVLRLNQHTPEVAIPLETVTSQIEKNLIKKNGLKQTKAAAMEVKAKIEAGEKIESFKTDGISLKVLTDLSRNDVTKVSSPAVLQSAFNLTPKSDGKPSAKVVDLVSGDVALVVLTGVKYPEEVSKEQLAVVKEGIERQNATSDFATVLSSIKSSAKIEMNKRLLDK